MRELGLGAQRVMLENLAFVVLRSYPHQRRGKASAHMFMKNHGIPRNFVFICDTKFPGIVGNLPRNTEEMEVQKTYGIPC
jgi:hypothetical protein